ncbi:uncharacterized protein LOC126654907 [Mercurialis annua]|uniref:uncharacterized protein LOC126654907 n=1 Tax=Mercurialis annua TaxID=3986 RepID=UPI00215ED2DE|nr:uncharacterized protein LOC126654907 [Mercurialis annua]
MANSTTYSTESTGNPIVSNPQYIAPSDNASFQITSHKLNGSNFREWYQSILLVMKGRGKMGYLTGVNTAPPLESAKYSTWEAENSIVMAWLINSMDQRIGRLYLFYQTAKEIWDAVKEMYSDLEDISQSFEIRSKIRNTRQSTSSVTEYFNTLSELWQEIDLFHNINWKCPDDGVLYSKMLEKDRIFDFLQGLNQDLDDVRGRILGMKPLPTSKEAFAEVRREETRRKVMSLPSQSAAIETAAQGSALATNRYSEEKDAKGAFGKDVWRCEHCKKPYHTKDTCWDLHGTPLDWKPRTQRRKKVYVTEITTSSTPQLFTDEQMEVLRKMVNSSSELSKSAPSNSRGSTALTTHKGSVIGEDDWEC